MPKLCTIYCMTTTLTDKQIKFCEYYFKTPNATQAAILAGYSEKSAASIGAENLTKPEIRKYISDKQAQLVNECAIFKNAVISELSRYGFRTSENAYTDVRAKDSIAALIKIAEYLGFQQPEKTELEKKREAVEIGKIEDQIKFQSKMSGVFK